MIIYRLMIFELFINFNDYSLTKIFLGTILF